MADANTGNVTAGNPPAAGDASGQAELQAEKPEQVLLLAILDLTAQSVCSAGLGRPFKSIEEYETYKAELIGMAVNRARRGIPVKFPPPEG